MDIAKDPRIMGWEVWDVGSRADANKIDCNAKNIKLVGAIDFVWKNIDFMFRLFVCVTYLIVQLGK